MGWIKNTLLTGVVVIAAASIFDHIQREDSVVEGTAGAFGDAARSLTNPKGGAMNALRDGAAFTLNSVEGGLCSLGQVTIHAGDGLYGYQGHRFMPRDTSLWPETAGKMAEARARYDRGHVGEIICNCFSKAFNKSEQQPKPLPPASVDGKRTSSINNATLAHRIAYGS